MGTFSTSAKPWLQSIIKQRKALIRFNKSHKDNTREAVALHNLEVQLNAYSYSDDLYMARFIRQHIVDIETVLPGRGSGCYESRMEEWTLVRKEAILIIEKLTKPHLHEYQKI